jgi:GrpB-like predicted nucleotidyltransferase (UPF0157 family)
LDFILAKDRLRETLGGTAKRIEHIGSTAVPGLDAKPVIDILLEVDSLTDPFVEISLEKDAYSLIVEEPGHRMFRSAGHDVHVHIWQSGSSEIDRHLLFRDRLQTPRPRSYTRSWLARGKA